MNNMHYHLKVIAGVLVVAFIGSLLNDWMVPFWIDFPMAVLALTVTWYAWLGAFLGAGQE
jgi:hypothetical protein